ncbi:hypothetical protein [Streptomyces sp. SID3343]|uniref:hypothetical protein n=1 Tax=Streptomyces sp. SID3343 TaxID=2690260 RepID=UPI00136D2076|nr:hypothetical protein [Streptomyces sp. SID3343]MYV99239.1 hypothetical protein [Streptomyces sp. SID3343]MYW03974.1 hypothetical protein [Streptomyces sp. SID3343]
MTDDGPNVVVVAAEQDLTADLVVSHLGGRATVLRLDPGRLRDEIEITARYAAGHWRTALCHRGRAVSLDRHCAVYWRKPTRPDSHDLADERWRADENTTALLGLLKAQPLKVWCNDPTVVAGSRLRPTQLAAAARVGLTVPDTLFTSDPDAARAFIADHDDKVVLKALTQRHTSLVPTTRIRLSDDLDRIAGTIHYLQDLVDDRMYDARVTVVDDHVFAAAITTDGELDWRMAPDGTADYAPITMPAHVERACVAHVRDLGLTFAALDFVVTARGWWYLETNCTGEFGFVQAHTNLPIAQAIARLLVDGPVHSHTSSTAGRPARGRM